MQVSELRSSGPLRLLLVDDDRADIKAVRRAFASAGIAHEMVVASDGIEALQVLRGSGEADPLSRPYVVLLDLNMPRMGGLELLRELRSDDELRSTIVFVFTTSDHERDKSEALDLNVAAYILKSNVEPDVECFTTLLDRYWRLCELPS